MPSDDQLLRLPDVIHLTALSRSRLYLLMRAGEFPRSRKIGPRARAWSKKEVLDWIAHRQRTRPGEMPA